MTDFAFYGRVSTEDNQEVESSRAWQLTRSRGLIESRGGVIVAEFFDVDRSRSVPWQRRPQASALLAELRSPGRAFDAVVIGEPHRAFYGNQFGLTAPLFQHFGVPLWVPEVGGPIDPDNEAHELVMSVFAGMSKGERQRIKVRVRTAMAAMALMEGGRHLGGRPPYGYLLVDLGPHPNPAKAADGRRLHGLGLDEPAAEVVRRIFAQFLTGLGIFAIAEGLTRDAIPSPAAHDRARNRHREGIAWSKSAIRAILINPRYTGRQVWNRQPKREVLIDIDDVGLGHITKQSWNPEDKWIFSERIVHPVIVDEGAFRQVQDLLSARSRAQGTHERLRTCRSYVLVGRVYCGLCGRKMQAHWANQRAYYRCRYPQEYALAANLAHPRNIFIREDHVVPQLDGWLSQAFSPPCLQQTIDQMTAAQDGLDPGLAAARAHRKIADCATKMARHRAALEAGADPAVVTQWITEAQAERVQAEAELRQHTGRSRMTKKEISMLVDSITGITTALRAAKPADKAELYRQLNLKLTYHPGQQKMQAETDLDRHSHGETVRVRGGT